jgi:two-component system OmpR family response regulator
MPGGAGEKGNMAKIFWVEDQSHWIDKFKRVLEGGDFDGRENRIDIFKFAEAAKQTIALRDKADAPDIAILDARMNGFDQAGFSVSAALQKKWPTLPIIFLSEYSGTELEKDALEQHHAKDFVSKHQHNVEEVLCWRIKAALRQAALQTDKHSTLPGNVLVDGALKMDLDTWDIYWHGVKLMNPDNPKRPLAPTPRKILRCLVERSPRPVSTGQIADYLDSDPDTYAAATYRQHIKTLRRAFDMAEGGSGNFLQRCKQGSGIVTFGSEGAYYWKHGNQAET